MIFLRNPKNIQPVHQNILAFNVSQLYQFHETQNLSAAPIERLICIECDHIKVDFPDGSRKLIHYDENLLNDLLNGLGRLLRSLESVQGIPYIIVN